MDEEVWGAADTAAAAVVVDTNCSAPGIVDGATVDDENNENWASADSKSFQNVMFRDDVWSDQGQVDDKYVTVAPAGVENTGDIVSYSCVCHFSFFNPRRSSTTFSCSQSHDSDRSGNFPFSPYDFMLFRFIFFFWS